ncbi:NAD(P)-dependent oxidoreductase [Kitasatospora phosalacinea]|uniref:2-hydroxyacid dehydrogenase n=1 Tax=Kitasatospora phosalacinea TaxID=2065 RepID=A0A9W6PLV0_9ACTN|nr:NAD(P)-dependent oxidoreductase [Kitasatospora phosalacinea]GLW58764.1 2-hydroxyacid dehydrogenase [Kitasatospora phosalacinea]
MTATVLVAKGAADPSALRLALPGVEITEVPDFDSLPDHAHRTTVVALRSGARLGREQLDRLPILRHVIRVGSGTDNIDLHELARRGITLHRNAHASATAVAEWCLVAALNLARRIPLGHNALARGRHMKDACLGRALSELDVAVWGAGPVGRSAASLLAPFARQIVFAQWPSNPPELPQLPAQALRERADVHVLAVPLRADTRRLFDEAFLTEVAERRPLVICAGRIETLDAGVFLHALDDGRIGGLALDAIDPEHLEQVNAAIGPRNLLVTPHIGAQRTDVRQALDTWLTQLIISITTGSSAAPEHAPLLEVR